MGKKVDRKLTVEIDVDKWVDLQRGIFVLLTMGLRKEAYLLECLSVPVLRVFKSALAQQNPAAEGLRRKIREELDRRTREQPDREEARSPTP